MHDIMFNANRRHETFKHSMEAIVGEEHLEAAAPATAIVRKILELE